MQLPPGLDFVLAQLTSCDAVLKCQPAGPSIDTPTSNYTRITITVDVFEFLQRFSLGQKHHEYDMSICFYVFLLVSTLVWYGLGVSAWLHMDLLLPDRTWLRCANRLHQAARHPLIPSPPTFSAVPSPILPLITSCSSSSDNAPLPSVSNCFR